jgi:flagellar hook assembly protein FlgD
VGSGKLAADASYAKTPFTKGELTAVKIDIYNIKGQKVKVLVDGLYPAGTHQVVWNGTDDNNKSVGSGIYFYKMTTEGYSETKKMILLK